MIVKEPGQVYTLQTAEGMDAFDISFCRKVGGIFVDGITNEELVNILEDRYKFLAHKTPTLENMKTLTFIQQAKEQINLRNFNKIKQQKRSVHTGNGIQLPAQRR